MERKKVTVPRLVAKKVRGERITMLTAYDYTGAYLVDAAAIDVILVGDSLGMVMMGLDTTLPVTMDEMLHHCRAVARGAKYAHLVGDMPFMSYQAEVAEAVRNAGRFLREGGMDSVKLEGGREMADTVRAIVTAGIPVLGHIGRTTQPISKVGGMRAQGKTAAAALRLLAVPEPMEPARCYATVLEPAPAPLAVTFS